MNSKNTCLPYFNESVKHNSLFKNNALTVYYSNQCPFTEYYVKVELVSIAEEYNMPLDIVKIDSLEKAKNSPSVFCNYSLFYKGKFLTHEIMNKNKFDKISKKFV